MVQGTASSVGKSIIVAALCRIFRQDGYQVTPFKAQNMALNSYVTKEGGEIGRAQVVQAEAAGIEPRVDMNPVLLKPASGTGCQIIVMGKVFKTVTTEDYSTLAPSLLETVEESLNRLKTEYDIIVIEGAGKCVTLPLCPHDKFIGTISWASIFPDLPVEPAISRSGAPGECDGGSIGEHRRGRDFVGGDTGICRGFGTVSSPAALRGDDPHKGVAEA